MKAPPEPQRRREDIVQGEAAKLADKLNANAWLFLTSMREFRKAGTLSSEARGVRDANP
jgi:hypothetical protein